MRKQTSGIRWTVNSAESEFGLNRRTINKRLRQSDIQPGDDGKFSTAQICSAVFGDIDSERLRLTKEQADKIAIDNAASRSELVNATELKDVVERGLAAMVQAVLAASNLENEDKDKIIGHLKHAGESVVERIGNRKAATKADG